ncbi:MAG TPA: hypothetical protein PLQ56_20780 [Aggregatilineales bacterium]|nr:hypothetical protein [Aggregatilineales bacterium]
MPVSGNALGLAMFITCGLIAAAGGFLLRLSNPIVMMSIGLALIVMDLLVRLKRRGARRWLLRDTTGGTLFAIPVWIVGVLVILLNLVNSFIPLDV